MLMGINAYGDTGSMTATKNGLSSVWNLSLSENYLSNNMYSYEATETQINSRKFDEVILDIVAVGMEGNAKNVVESSGVYTLTGNVMITPGNDPVGIGICDYSVYDELYGEATYRIIHN